MQCPTCQKEFKRLKMHQRLAHPTEEVEMGIEDKAKAFGIDLEEAMKLAEPLIASAVAKTLGEMKLGEVIDKAVGDRVSQVEKRLSQQITGVVETIKQIPASQTVESTQVLPGQQSSRLQDTVVAALAQKVLGGGDSDSFDKFFDRMIKMQQMSAIMFNNPFEQASRMLTNFMTAGSRAGMTKEEIMGGLGDLAKPPEKPKL